jgi:hypothetical protein
MLEPEEIPARTGGHVHPSVRFEQTDASLPAILVIMASALAFAVVTFAVVWFFFLGYARQLDTARKSKFPLAPIPSTALPPEPRLEELDRLEGNAVANVYARQRAKEARLKRYGKTDEAGYVYIPIETAIKHLADKLPVRKEQPKGPRRDLGLVGAGEPNSGRLFREDR